MAHFPDRHIPYYVSTFGKDCIVFDVSNCRETSMARIEAALRRHSVSNATSIETVTRNKQSVIVRHPNASSNTIHLFRKDGYGTMTVPEGRTCADIIHWYLALEVEDISEIYLNTASDS